MRETIKETRVLMKIKLVLAEFYLVLMAVGRGGFDGEAFMTLGGM